jgi:hypothetical protein
MKISKIIDLIGTSISLKRIASAYVIDYRNLSDESIREALKKTAPQYYYPANVQTALKQVLLKESRQHRILARLILREVILNEELHRSACNSTDEAVLAYEQNIIDLSNEDLFRKGTARTEQLDLLKFVLETAWENNSDISADEFNLVEKLRVRLKITDREHRTIEATLNRFPKPGNILHTRQEIEETRRLLQSKGLLFTIRDENSADFDVIPYEISTVLRDLLGHEIRSYGYHQLVNHKFVRSKSYLLEMLQKGEIEADKNLTVADLQKIVIEQVSPRILLGGVSPRDGLDPSLLKKWCGEVGLTVSGNKAELISRLVEFYDNLVEQTSLEGDPREVWYENYERFATRDLEYLRSQQLIEKDLDCEAHFEDATDFLFEKRLNHKPLKLIGSAHADGVLSFRDRVIVWDNKSKEKAVHLKDHVKQFEGYIRNSERPVAGFWVIGPDFTLESQALAMQFTVDTGVTITLIRAADLKTVAEAWEKKNGDKSDEAFPLGYLIQSGLFNPALVAV